MKAHVLLFWRFSASIRLHDLVVFHRVAFIEQERGNCRLLIGTSPERLCLTPDARALRQLKRLSFLSMEVWWQANRVRGRRP